MNVTHMTYDPAIRCAYFYCTGSPSKPGNLVDRTVVLSSSINIDLNADGSVFGIEWLNLRADISIDRLIYLNEEILKDREWENHHSNNQTSQNAPYEIMQDLHPADPEHEDVGHGCGRNDCGLSRDPDTNTLYWAKLVCGHGVWPCAVCRYPIHPFGRCPAVAEPRTDSDNPQGRK